MSENDNRKHTMNSREESQKATEDNQSQETTGNSPLNHKDNRIINHLKHETEASDDRITDLESKLQLVNRIESLEIELEEKIRRLRQAEQSLESESQKIRDLEQELARKQEAMELMAREYSSSLAEFQANKGIPTIDAERFEKLANDIATLESYNATIKSALTQRETELEEIRNSVIYGMAKRISTFIDSNAPPNSARRRLLKGIQRVIINKTRHGADRVLQENISDSQNTDPHTPKSTINTPLQGVKISSIISELRKLEAVDSERLESDFTAPTNALPSRNTDLEKFIDYGSHEITKLQSNPLISIIIATYNNVPDLRRNIQSIEARTTYSNFEIIIVTNNKDTNSEMRRYLSTLSKHGVYIYDSEYSFAGINNYAARKANGQLLLFLNDDTEVVEPRWLEPLVKLMEQPSTGAVGGMMIYPDGTLQDAGGIVWGDRNIWNYGKFLYTPEDPNVNYVREVDYCSGAFLMVRKSIFDEIGGFDTIYHPAYCEDVDLCFAIRDRGYSVLFQPKSVIMHREGATQGTDTSKGIKAYQISNQKKFFEKWSHKLEGRLPSAQENIFAERSRKSGKRILFIDHYVPMPDQDSGSLRTFYTLGILAWLGHEITFWPDNLARFEPYVTELQQKGIEVILGPNNFDEFLAKRGSFFEIVILTRPHIAINYIDKITKMAPHCKMIYDTTDLHFLRLYRQAVLEKDPYVAREAKNIKTIELKLARTCDATLVVTKKEAAILKDQDQKINPVILPNIHIPVGDIVGYGQRKNIYFIGGFQHPPNTDAAIYLALEIFPLIKEQIKEIKLFIVGSNPPEKVKELATNDIEITDYVPDITPYLNNCRVMVAPLRYGAGLKGKITQATSHGLPVVTTDIGAEGTGLIDGQSVLIGNTAREFAEKVVEVYSDKLLWEKISITAYSEAMKRYSPENISDMFKELLQSLEKTERLSPLQEK